MIWKNFFAAAVLYRAMTNDDEILEVVEQYGRKTLVINGFPQTKASYKSNWKKIFHKIGLRRMESVGFALVLGLGGGDAISEIAETQPKWAIKAIEIEPQVIKVAKDYFGLAQYNQLHIVPGDAQSMVGRDRDTYNLVIVDLYNGDEVPSFVEKLSFLRELESRLEDGGVMVINYASHHFTKQKFAEFEQKLKQIFFRVELYRTWGHTYYLVHTPLIK